MDDIGFCRDFSQVDDLSDRFGIVRGATEALVASLSDEDQCVQSMPDASPAKWHRAHTTWFFECFILLKHARQYQLYNPEYNFLFNSYYEAVGERHARDRRGLLTRPSAGEVSDYRRTVDRGMCSLLESGAPDSGILSLVALGLRHEQQHQELLLTDTLHAFAQNPVNPVYGPY